MGNCCRKWMHPQPSEEDEGEGIALPTDEMVSALVSQASDFYVAQEDVVVKYTHCKLKDSFNASERIRRLSKGKLLLVAGKTLEAFDDNTNSLFVLKGHTKPINGVLQHETIAVSGSADWSTRVWDLTKQTQLDTNTLNWNVVTSMSWINKGSAFVQTSEDLKLRIWDVRQSLQQEVAFASVGDNFATCCDVKEYIATGHRGFNGKGSHTKLWDRRKLAEVVSQEHHQEAVMSVKWVGETLVTGGKDGALVVATSRGEFIEKWQGAPIQVLEPYLEGFLAASVEPQLRFYTLQPLTLRY